MEDLLTYTEVDVGGDLITVTSSKVMATLLDRDVDVYLYKDFGADSFDELDIDFDFYYASTSGGSGLANFGLTDTLNDAKSWVDPYIRVHWSDKDTVALQISGGVSDSGTISTDTLYYCTLSRVAGSDTVYLYIYTDATRETLHDALTATGAGTDKYKYLYVISSWNSGHNALYWNGYIQNLNLNEAAQSDAVAGVLSVLAPTVGLYDTRFKLRARNRDTALTTRVRNT